MLTDSEPKVYPEVQQKNEPGMRFDNGKQRWDLVPPEFEDVVAVYTFGARKYADRNWEKGMSWGRVFGSLIRHAWSFWRGEDYDKESGLHHMAHVTWNAIALLTYSKRGVGTDDRVRVPVDGLRVLPEHVGSLAVPAVATGQIKGGLQGTAVTVRL